MQWSIIIVVADKHSIYKCRTIAATTILKMHILVLAVIVELEEVGEVVLIVVDIVVVVVEVVVLVLAEV